MAHWFGIHGADLGDMPSGEIDEFVSRILSGTLPPIGGSVRYVKKGD